MARVGPQQQDHLSAVLIEDGLEFRTWCCGCSSRHATSAFFAWTVLLILLSSLQLANYACLAAIALNWFDSVPKTEPYVAAVAIWVAVVEAIQVYYAVLALLCVATRDIDRIHRLVTHKWIIVVRVILYGLAASGLLVVTIVKQDLRLVPSLLVCVAVTVLGCWAAYSAGFVEDWLRSRAESWITRSSQTCPEMDDWLMERLPEEEESAAIRHWQGSNNTAASEEEHA